MLVSGIVSSSIWREDLGSGEERVFVDVEREDRSGSDSRAEESAELVAGDIFEGGDKYCSPSHYFDLLIIGD